MQQAGLPDSETALSPQELSPEQKEIFIGLVAEGGAVARESVQRSLPESEKVVLVARDGKIVAVGSIKGKRPKHVADVSKSSGYGLDPEIRELGYVAVSPVYQNRRLSSLVMDMLVAAWGKQLFATTHEAKMKTALGRRGFSEVGSPWPSKMEPGAQLSLWIRPMIKSK